MESRQKNLYDFCFKKSAEKYLNKLPKNYYRLIRAKIELLRIDPYGYGSIKIEGSTEEYRRVRQGDFRIIYEVDNGKLIFTVIKIDSRGDVYKLM
jgi:mRNA interferase RelE/StbE